VGYLGAFGALGVGDSGDWAKRRRLSLGDSHSPGRRVWRVFWFGECNVRAAKLGVFAIQSEAIALQGVTASPWQRLSQTALCADVEDSGRPSEFPASNP
jgi:hypothetical protein